MRHLQLLLFMALSGGSLYTSSQALPLPQLNLPGFGWAGGHILVGAAVAYFLWRLQMALLWRLLMVAGALVLAGIAWQLVGRTLLG